MAEDTTDEGTLSSTPSSPAPQAEGPVPAVAADLTPAVEPVGSAAQATEQAQAKKAARRSRKLVTPAEAEATPSVAPEPAPLAEPVVAAPVVEEPVAAAPVVPPVAKPAPAKASKPLARNVGKPGAARPAVAKPLPTGKAPAKAVPAKPPVAKPLVTTRPGTGIPHAKVPAPLTTRVTHAAAAASRKEHSIMTTATDFSEKFQSAFKDASEKAKAAFEKSQAAFGDAGEFAKGNVEAVVESSKILASGLQELTKDYAAEGKSAIETLTAEIKELASAKSPTEFFEKHTALVRKQFDAAVAASSKHSEAVLKLANEAFQPISNRVSLAVEKIKVAA
ncbi:MULTISPECIES: TIGR01841 family phasin [unclassified Sphingomonas]|uniref:phasin family protein n=1 Tax=Novosphingobium rhizosphaerae TaxID=1551649 RepID=UPI0015CB682A